MLRQLNIQNLAVVELLDLHFESGMTTLTGETGAGKSILIDALSLSLGARAEASLVRPGATQASVSAVFELENLPQVSLWLKEQDLGSDDCILRRTITNDGRSKAYINGQPVPLTQLKELGEYLINIHGQHQHQSLLKPEYQRELLDHYAQHPDLLQKVAECYQNYESLKKEQQSLLALQGQEDKLALLRYQIGEFEELDVRENELQDLETEHRKLSHAEQWLTITTAAIAALRNDDVGVNEEMELSLGKAGVGGNAFDALQNALSQITLLKNQFPKLASCAELVNNALIQVEEASDELQAFRETVQLDPERLRKIDERLSNIHTVARKHKILPELILDHLKGLCNEADKIQDIQGALASIAEKMNEAKELYVKSAEALRTSRKKAGKALGKLITGSLHHLEMSQGIFEVQIKEQSNFNKHGMDEIEFLVTTNPGHPLQPLRKIASGGELSRISLAIQVITAEKLTTPTLIFDEVDVGVSGKTAEIVGKLLRQLAGHTQVLCVTHLPQVAAQGHHHYKVEKQQSKNSTTTRIYELDNAGKIKEIARLLGGINITKNTLAHAEEMLAGV